MSREVGKEMIKRAICFGCSSQAGVLATVEDGKVVRLKGEPDHYMNRGWLCERARGFIEHVYHPERLNYPLKRVGEKGEGKWERISWERALDEIAEKLAAMKKKYGAEALVSLGGTGRGHQETFKRRFMNLFGSPNNANAGQWCAIVTYIVESAIMGFLTRSKGGANPSRCIVIWGHNPEESQPCPYRTLVQLKRSGTKFIVIDPKYTESVAELADIWLPIRPGTDAALALGWMHVIISEDLYDRAFVERWCHGFDALKERVKDYPPDKVAEITWIPKEKIVESARLYATHKPGSIYWGLKTDMQGINVTSALHSKSILRAITGNLDIAGGEMLYGPCEKANYGPLFEYTDRLSAEQRAKQLGSDRHKLWTWPGYELIQKASMPYWYGKGGVYTYAPACHVPDVFQAILTEKPYPIKAVIAGGNNALLAYANTRKIYHALKSSNLELFVILEQWMTPTAMLADYVFPVANWLEMPVMHISTLNGLAQYAAVGEKVIDPLYERKPDYYFYKGLGLRLGQEGCWRETLEEEWNYFLKPLLDDLNLKSAEEFAQKQRWWMPPLVERRYEKIDPINGKVKGFATPTGKVELYSTILERLGYDPLPNYHELPETPFSDPELAKRYPLILITGSRFRPLHHSEHRQIPSLRRLYPYPTMEIHPDTARKRKIADGDWVMIETVHGKIRMKAKLSSKIHPRMVDVQHGWWFPEEIPEDPVLYGVFQSNANMLTTDEEEYCDGPTGAIQFSPLLCTVHPVKKYESEKKQTGDE
jgi:anaerobic selenocysteine-containing dehydrogenase